MKQVIILISTIILGLAIVNCVLGDNGIYNSMQGLWAAELDAREMQVVGQ